MKEDKKHDLNTFGGRMSWARVRAGYSQTAAAKKIGIQQPTLSELEGSESQGSSKVVGFAKLYGVSAEWLADGVGEPLTSSPAGVGRKFAMLPPDRQKLVENLIDEFLDSATIRHRDAPLR